MNIFKKYITECAWSSVTPNRLALSSLDEDIQLFTIQTNDSNELVRNDGKLIGHKHGINTVKWSTHTEHRLLSCSNDCTVRVWDTEKLECISLYMYNYRVHCAIFSPNDENIIFATGMNETMHAFDIRKHVYEKDLDLPKDECKSIAIDFKYATEIVVKTNKDKAKDLKKQRKKQSGNGNDEATSSCSGVAGTPPLTSDFSNNTDDILSEALKQVSLGPIQVILFRFLFYKMCVNL